MIRKFLINKNLPSSKRVGTQYIEESFLSLESDIILKMIKTEYNKKENTRYSIIFANKDIEIELSTYRDLLNNIEGKSLEIVKRIYLIDNIQVELNSYKDLGIKILLINDEDIDKPILPPILNKEVTNDEAYNHKTLSQKYF